jgi:molybdate transport system substrate-binding protein
VPTLRAVAASSLLDVLPDLATTLGFQLETRFGANSVLHRQVREGLPVDLLLSADLGETQRLAKAGSVGSPSVFARNVVEVAVSAKTRRHGSASSASLDWKQANRIAVGRLETTASGREVRRVLLGSNDLARLAPRLIQTSTVRQARQLLLSGEVDVALLFRSDRVAAGSALASLGPLAGSRPLPCACAVLISSHQRVLAHKFQQALLGSTARGILARHGFEAP